MSRHLIKPPPQTDAELIRQFGQRIAALERKDTVRIGDHVLTQDDRGRVLLIGPGTGAADVGNPVVDEIDLTALRGYVSPADVAQAVSGGTTNSLPIATGTQVGRDVATANAQYIADTANAAAAEALALINTGVTGYNFTDTFDRPYATDLGPEYNRVVIGVPNGAYGTDGSGYAASVVVDGAQTQQWIDQHVTPTNTNNQIIGSALDTPPQLSASGTNSNHCLRARVNAAGTDYVQAAIQGGSVTLGYTLGGTYHEVVPWTGIGQANGDAYSFRAGTAIDPTQYTLLRNGLATPAVWTDLGGLFPIDASHRFGAMANLAGTTVYSFFLTIQIPAPKVQQFIVSDSIA